jgi:hypothetical protein
MYVTFYKIASGEITRFGSVEDPDTECLGGEAWIEGEHKDTLYRVEGGAVASLNVTDVDIAAWDVNVERDRRLALGFDYDFSDARGIHQIGTTAEDMVGWNDVTILAQAMINSGVSSGMIDVETDTGPVRITALEWQQILIAAGNFRQLIWAKSFTLTAMNPIPMDYTEDKWWSPPPEKA